MRLLLIRHGETESNSAGKHQGWGDVKLSQKGKEQARKVQESIKNIKFDSIVASDIYRAKETAEIIFCHCRDDIKYSALLREINCGNLMGLNYEAAVGQFGDTYVNARTVWDYSPFEGESNAEFLNRAKSFLEKYENTSKGGNVAVITHGGTMRAIMSCILNIDMKFFANKFVTHNCSLSEVEFTKDGWKINYINREAKLASLF